jgi:hypothetical protein
MGGDSIVSVSDRDLMKRLGVVVAFIFVFTAAFSHLAGVYSQKFYDRTAPAQLVWARHPMSANEPVAFFAAHEVTLPPNRIYTRLKLLGDPEYTLYVNGREIAGRLVREDRALDYYDLSEVVQTGRNRIVIAVRAPKGAGALLAALDIAPETENWAVTDSRWKIYRRWDPLILQYDVAGNWETPAIIGAPPIGRWNFLEIVKREPEVPAANVLAAKESFELVALLPTIRTRQASPSPAASARVRVHSTSASRRGACASRRIARARSAVSCRCDSRMTAASSDCSSSTRARSCSRRARPRSRRRRTQLSLCGGVRAGCEDRGFAVGRSLKVAKSQSLKGEGGSLRLETLRL